MPVLPSAENDHDADTGCAALCSLSLYLSLYLSLSLSLFCALSPFFLQLAIVQGIRRAKDTVAALVRSRSYIAALDAIDDAEAIIARDLLGVHAVA